MRRSVTVATLLLLSVVPVSLLAQQSAQTAPAPTRDPQAVAILHQALASMGETAKTGTQDIQVTGKVFNPGDTTTQRGVFTAKLRGLDFTMDMTRDGVRSTYSVLGNHGFIRRDGKVKPLPSFNTAGLSLDILPIFARWSEFTRDNTEVQAVTTAQIDGRACYVIHVDVQSPGNMNQHGKIEVSVDQATLLILAIRYRASESAFANGKLAVENHYANYQNFGGLMLPTRVTRSLNGQPTVVLQIEAAQTNNGFKDSDFSN